MDDLFYKQYTHVFNSYRNRYETEDPLSLISQFIERLQRGIQINRENKEEIARLTKLKAELEVHRMVIVRGFDLLSSEYLDVEKKMPRKDKNNKQRPSKKRNRKKTIGKNGINSTRGARIKLQEMMNKEKNGKVEHYIQL